MVLRTDRDEAKGNSPITLQFGFWLTPNFRKVAFSLTKRLSAPKICHHTTRSRSINFVGWHAKMPQKLVQLSNDDWRWHLLTDLETVHESATENSPLAYAYVWHVKCSWQAWIKERRKIKEKSEGKRGEKQLQVHWMSFRLPRRMKSTGDIKIYATITNRLQSSRYCKCNHDTYHIQTVVVRRRIIGLWRHWKSTIMLWNCHRQDVDELGFHRRSTVLFQQHHYQNCRDFPCCLYRTGLPVFYMLLRIYLYFLWTNLHSVIKLISQIGSTYPASLNCYDIKELPVLRR